MANKPAPKPSQVWNVTYKYGWSQQLEDTVSIVADDLSDLLVRWEQHVARSLKYTVLPTVVKAERGSWVYA